MTNRHGPDTTASMGVYLTCEELGRAFAKRCDDEQVAALKATVAELGDEAGMQACYIGRRLLESCQERSTENVIEFLRLILAALASRAQDVAKMATPKEPTP